MTRSTQHDLDFRLLQAVSNGHVGMIRKLVKQGANVNHQDTGQEWTLLHHAVEKKQLRALKTLIELGAKVNQPDKFGSTPLHQAAYFGDVRAAQALLEAKADPTIHAKEIGDYTPLHTAAEYGHASVVRVLVRHGARVNEPLSGSLHTPLHVATSFKFSNTRTVRALLEAGANPHALNAANETPLADHERLKQRYPQWNKPGIRPLLKKAMESAKPKGK